MNPDSVVGIARETLWTAMLLAAPVLIVGLVVGLVVAVLQAVTSVQEQTLAQIPKMLAVALTLVLLMPWMIETILDFTRNTFGRMGSL
jgi:flagellar biosynthetic protein FliQ